MVNCAVVNVLAMTMMRHKYREPAIRRLRETREQRTTRFTVIWAPTKQPQLRLRVVADPRDLDGVEVMECQAVVHAGWEQELGFEAVSQGQHR